MEGGNRIRFIPTYGKTKTGTSMKLAGIWESPSTLRDQLRLTPATSLDDESSEYLRCDGSSYHDEGKNSDMDTEKFPLVLSATEWQQIKLNENSKNASHSYAAENFQSSFTHKDAQKHWEEIAQTLISIPGANIDWKAWRKTWQDYLSKTKSKSAAIKKIRSGTGGSPPPPNPLDQFEEGVAALFHPYAVATASSESSVVFNFKDKVIWPPPIIYAGETEAGDDGKTAASTEMQPPTTGTQPPLTNSGGKTPPKIPPDEALDRVASMLGALCSVFTVEFGGDREELVPSVEIQNVEILDV
ncbi:unnamed protein product [Euphydryas editha]|uniref:Nuclear apoptosis-inducing factor 1 n=1 Tax=Euphydryas editha TaxID=104508 RepID=A0AAU9USS1_EUPED|nr:unnamed protein product [Euphydryas editha]